MLWRATALCTALAACTTDADVGAFNEAGSTAGNGGSGGDTGSGGTGGAGGAGEVGPPPASTARIAAGSGTTCAIRSSGKAQCWGDNSAGQLGNNDDFIDGPLITTTSTPTDVYGMDDHLQAVFGGAVAQCALKTDGRVWCWGDSLFGEFFPGVAEHVIAPYPMEAMGLSGVVQFAIGYYFHCALNVEGTVKCYGLNGSGQLGNGSLKDSYVGAGVTGLEEPVVHIAAAQAGFAACAVLASGALRCWGSNTAGQLGNGTLSDAYVPEAVPALQGGVHAVTMGFEHACAITDDGVRCWGANNEGQLGDGEAYSTMEPGAPLALPEAVALASGSFHSCALGADGSVHCWGGEVGPTTPQQVIASGAVEITAAGRHTCALLDSGTLRCWGLNDRGQLGPFGGAGAPL